jgi:hypothetical protein
MLRLRGEHVAVACNRGFCIAALMRLHRGAPEARHRFR